MSHREGGRLMSLCVCECGGRGGGGGQRSEERRFMKQRHYTTCSKPHTRNTTASVVSLHIRRMPACLAVTCHLHFWQNDRDLLRATAA